MSLSFHRWPTRPSSDIYAGRDTSSGGVLASSYCCSTYRVADPPSSLGTSSSSSIGGPVIHPIADCEHPLLCLLGPGIASQETAISGSFRLSSKLCLCSSFHGCLALNFKKGQSIHTLVFVLPEIHVFHKLYLISWVF